MNVTAWNRSNDGKFCNQDISQKQVKRSGNDHGYMIWPTPAVTLLGQLWVLYSSTKQVIFVHSGKNHFATYAKKIMCFKHLILYLWLSKLNTTCPFCSNETTPGVIRERSGEELRAAVGSCPVLMPGCRWPADSCGNIGDVPQTFREISLQTLHYRSSTNPNSHPIASHKAFGACRNVQLTWSVSWLITSVTAGETMIDGQSRFCC